MSEAAAHPYDEDYYRTHCGPRPYGRGTPEFLEFFGKVADGVILGLRPKRVFDAGCAMGLLVEALWDRGVEAHGRDISEYAIGEVRPDMRDWCRVGDVADAIEGRYDLVTSIEVLEHVAEAEALKAIASMCAATDRILFSSSPDDHEEDTHRNVRPVTYWLRRFSEAGFAPVVDFNASFLTPHAYLLARTDAPPPPELLEAFASVIRLRMALTRSDARVGDLGVRVEELEAELEETRLAAAVAEADRLRAKVTDLERTTGRLSELLELVEVLRARGEADRLRVASLEGDAEDGRVAHDEAVRNLSEARRAIAGRDATLAGVTAELDATRTGATMLRLALAAEQDRTRRQAPHVERLGNLERRRRNRLRRALTLHRFRHGTYAHAVDLPADEVESLVREVRHSGLFDGAHYLSEHPDVAASGMDPVVHFVLAGMAEGRSPNAHFDAAHYVASNPDVASDGTPPFLHFLRTGLAEGRAPSPAVALGHVPTDDGARLAAAVIGTGMFDAEFYAGVNDDVRLGAVDPAEHYATDGWREGRWPNAWFDPIAYLADHPDVAAAGENPLVHYARSGVVEGRGLRRHPSALTPLARVPDAPSGLPTARSLVAAYERAWSHLPIHRTEGEAPTLTLLTDGIDPASLFGGVGTALVIGALLAARLGMRLRIATRGHAPDPGALGTVLDAHRIDWTGPTDFAHVPPDSDRPLGFGHDDLMLTTSWWTTRAAVGAVGADRVVYVLQEDERMFHPHGDERLRASETLSTPGVRTLVNTRMLFDHLAATLPPGFADSAVPFTPAFPATAGKAPAPRSGKRRLFVYARPGHTRNLWWRALDALDEAIARGVIDPARWEVHLVGGDVPEMELARGVVPVVTRRLPWRDYADLLATMDLGLCLMDTPHPSYPPIDLASVGAVVVTCAHGPKTDLSDWSENILVAEPTVEGLVGALERAVALVDDPEERARRFAAQAIPTSWAEQLAGPFAKLFG